MRFQNVAFLILIKLLLFSAPASAEDSTQQHIDITVAQDGTGNHKTLTEAIDALPMYTYERTVIFIKNGVYEEKIRIDQHHITLIGESRANTIIQFFQPRQDWEDNKDVIGPAIINIHADDVILKNLTIINTQPKKDIHAFTIYGTGTRTILDNCSVKSQGGDTVSLWNYKDGMYYHSNCFFEGAVDFVCPRGWCYIKDSEFFEVRKTAAIWHAAVVDENQKMVIRNSRFDGVEGFYLGRHHYEAQFFLLGCSFSKTMIDKPIYHEVNLGNPEKNRPYFFGDRYYYFDCHRDGEDYGWFSDNLQQNNFSEKEITAEWTFDGKWNPENKTPLMVKRWKLIGNDLHLFFDDCLTIRGEVVLETATGKRLHYEEGRGRNQLRFSTETTLEESDFLGSLKLFAGSIVANQATLAEREMESTFTLPY